MEIVRENELSDKVVVLHGRIEVHFSVKFLPFCHCLHIPKALFHFHEFIFSYLSVIASNHHPSNSVLLCVLSVITILKFYFEAFTVLCNMIVFNSNAGCQH